MQDSGSVWSRPLGQSYLQWAQTQLDQSVVDLFGYHAIQLGFPELDALRTSRIQHRWYDHTEASPLQAFAPPSFRDRPDAVAWMDSTALPLAPQSLDLVVLPHTLELSHDPHQTLREVERVLVAEGKVVIQGFNPWSLWGWRQQRSRWLTRLSVGEVFMPDHGEWLGIKRVRDWLHLLGFEVQTSAYGVYRPAWESAQWLARTEWMERAGDRWWPFGGAAYALVAIKRVRGMRWVKPIWRRSPARGRRAVTSLNSTGAHRHNPGQALGQGVPQRKT